MRLRDKKIKHQMCSFSEKNKDDSVMSDNQFCASQLECLVLHCCIFLAQMPAKGHEKAYCYFGFVDASK